MMSSAIELFCLFWASTLISCIVINARIVVYPNTSEFQIDDKEADFGASLPTKGIPGLLVIARPINACTPIIPVPKIFPYNYRFFALVEEANCPSSHQALMVQSAGYKAMILYRKNSNSPTTLSGGVDADRINIVCVSIGKNSGGSLRRYDYTTKTEIKLFPPSIKVPIELYLIPFLVVFGVCFLFMAIFSTARYCRYRRLLVNSRLSKESLKSIPTRKFKKGDEYDLCAICLDEFEVGDKLRVLPCSHVYHCKCVDPWLTGGKKSCPVCNRRVSVNRQSKNRRTRSTPSASSTNNEQTENEQEDSNAANERTPLISAAADNSSRRNIVVDL